MFTLKAVTRVPKQNPTTNQDYADQETLYETNGPITAERYFSENVPNGPSGALYKSVTFPNNDVDHTFTVFDEGTVYVMNGTGKTVDRFHLAGVIHNETSKDPHG